VSGKVIPASSAEWMVAHNELLIADALRCRDCGDRS
jgi:hypothetical protein